MKEKKILIEYLYDVKLTPYIDYTKLGPVAKINENKKPDGIVIATGSSIIGWALCDKHDVFNKKEALKLALIRADMVDCIDSVSDNILEDFYQLAVPRSLTDLVYRMNTRSIKYFKD